MLLLAILAAAQAPVRTDSAQNPRVPLESGAAINSLDIDATGKISGCKLQPLGEATLRDDPGCIGAFYLRRLASVLPNDLTTVSKIDIRMLFQVEGAPPVVRAERYDTQTIIFRVVADFAPDGTLGECKTLIARPVAGTELFDPCKSIGPGNFKGKPYSPDPEGLHRTVDVTFDVSIKLRAASKP